MGNLYICYTLCSSSESDGKWDYYTLECLLYFLKNIKRSHPDYVKQARGEVPIVHRPDRRDLIAYLASSLVALLCLKIRVVTPN